MKFPFVRSLLATLLLAAGVAHAADDEAKVKKNLEAFIKAMSPLPVEILR